MTAAPPPLEADRCLPARTLLFPAWVMSAADAPRCGATAPDRWRRRLATALPGVVGVSRCIAPAGHERGPGSAHRGLAVTSSDPAYRTATVWQWPATEAACTSAA